MHINELLSAAAEFKQTVKLMGNRFEITVVADDEQWATQKIVLAIAEIRRIEKLLTTFDESSETNQINQQAGLKPIQVDREVYNLIERPIRISNLTDGAFDLTYGSIDKSLWNFDKTMKNFPDPTVAKLMVRLINFRNIILDAANSTVFLKEKGMRISFEGIGKGYAAQMEKALLKKEGAQAGIVNASGDLTTWGVQANGKPWTIGIANPNNAQLRFSYMNIIDMAVATSGTYEKFVTINGKKYSHTINPATGLPVVVSKVLPLLVPM